MKRKVIMAICIVCMLLPISRGVRAKTKSDDFNKIEKELTGTKENLERKKVQEASCIL